MALPKKYKTFSFDSYEINLQKNRITFHYSIDNEIFFDPYIELDLSRIKNPQQIETAVFNFGMAEIPSFYKTVCTKEIFIKAGYLNEEQKRFWQNIFIKGLGEMFYQNNIDFRGLAKIRVQPDAKNHDYPTLKKTQTKAKYLATMGGGKDSIVTGEMLKKRHLDFTWFMIEPWSVCKKVIKASGNNKSIIIGRNPKKYFSKVIELNKKGFYNGHVPITSTYIFGAVLAAKIHGFTHLVLSNERSANIGNVKYLGMEVNHQYSKSFEFEKAAHDYIKKYIDPQIYFFSLLRNLYEIQVAQKFCDYPQYFSKFLSCNVGLSKGGGWCGECSKCAFVFAILSAFLEPQILQKIFRKNLFEDKKLFPIFEELLGIKGFKPFNCVGVPEEVWLALYLAKTRFYSNGSGGERRVARTSKKLPYLFSKIPVERGKKYFDLLTDTTQKHLIPFHK